MTWYAVAEKWWSDEDVEAATPWAWPLILDAIASGAGVAAERALCDARLIRCAGLAGVVVADGNAIRERFEAVGLLVEVEGGWTARSWPKWQRPLIANRERQARHREKVRDVAATSTNRPRNVTTTLAERQRDVSETATVQYSTVQTVQNSSSLLGGSDPSRLRAHTTEAGTESELSRLAELDGQSIEQLAAAAPTRDGLTEVIDAFRTAQPGVRDSGGILRGAGLFLSPAATAQLAVLVTDHGPDRVLEAIAEAVASDSKGGVTIRFVASIAERMAKGTPKPGATHRGVAYRNSDPTRECGPKSTEPNEW